MDTYFIVRLPHEVWHSYRQNGVAEEGISMKMEKIERKKGVGFYYYYYYCWVFFFFFFFFFSWFSLASQSLPKGGLVMWKFALGRKPRVDRRTNNQPLIVIVHPSLLPFTLLSLSLFFFFFFF